MARSTLLLGLFIILGFSTPVNGAGLNGVYTLPCGPGNYTIIAVINNSYKAPYTLYAADGITVVAGPQMSNVFTNIAGIAGNNFSIAVQNIFNGQPELTSFVLNAGTSTINAQISCFCTLGIPPDCAAVPRADSIHGASFLWTSPSGLTYTSNGFVAPGNPPGRPENGVWTVSATLNTGTCIHTLTNSVTLSNCFSGLPLKLTYFRGTASGCSINVEWGTAQEENSDRFEIETSEDGVSGWEAVKVVKAAGYSSSDIAYKETIPSLKAGYLYMRLKQVDADRHLEYSKIVKIKSECESNELSISVSPGITPPGGTVTLKLTTVSGKGEYYIIANDISGRQLLQKRIEVNLPVTQHAFPINGLGKGMYLLRVVNTTSGQKSNITRLIVQ